MGSIPTPTRKAKSCCRLQANRAGFGLAARDWLRHTVTHENGATVASAVIDHPGNPPALWHGVRLVSFLNPCIAAPREVSIPAGRPLTLRHRVVTQDGRFPPGNSSGSPPSGAHRGSGGRSSHGGTELTETNGEDTGRTRTPRASRADRRSARGGSDGAGREHHKCDRVLASGLVAHRAALRRGASLQSSPSSPLTPFLVVNSVSPSSPGRTSLCLPGQRRARIIRHRSSRRSH